MFDTSANAVARVNALSTLMRSRSGDVYLANGVFYNFAYILGDYEFQLETEDYDIAMHVNGTNSQSGSGRGTDCNPERNKGYIHNLSSSILNYITNEEIDYGQIYATVTEYDTVSAYGYSLDLAFRSNQSGYVMLQQKAADRVSGEELTGSSNDNPEDNAATQGSGCNMTFTFARDLSKDQVESLMQSVYIVFMSDYNRILAVASAGSVKVRNRTASADIVLYNFNTDSGIVRITSRKPSNQQSIASISSDIPTYITAVVYLSGDAATSASVSATQLYSLTGKINLQFAHSAELHPASGSFAE